MYLRDYYANSSGFFPFFFLHILLFLYDVKICVTEIPRQNMTGIPRQNMKEIPRQNMTGIPRQNMTQRCEAHKNSK
jgi:hypothetical protein